jgi:ribokinase
MPVERQNALLRFFSGSTEIITVDLPWHPETMNALELPEVGLASAIFLSDAELKGHFGKLPAEAAVAALRARGARLVTIKHGRHGSVTYPENDLIGHRVPAIETEVRDPSGAGDAFCGGFAVGLWESHDPLVAAQYGTVSASFVIEAFGALYAMSIDADSPRDRLSALSEKASRPH